MNWLGLEEKVAVVTGAAGGIGRAVARELARNGAAVALLDLDHEGARRSALEIEQTHAEATAAQVDTSDVASIADAVETVVARWGRVDILVNNAGILRAGTLRSVTPDQWQRVLDVNLTGYLLCAQQFGSVMRDGGGGAMVHVASIAASHPQGQSGAYSPSKAAVSMLSRQLAFEWGPDGIRSNTVSPGMTPTPMTEAIYRSPGVLEARSEVVPLRRVATPQDIADACAWLASSRAAYVTGQDVVVDGGFGQTLMSHIPRPGF